MNTEQYFILTPKTVGEKTEVCVIKQFFAKDFAEALAMFEKFIMEKDGLNAHFLVGVYGKGQKEVEMNFKFAPSGTE